MHGCKALHVVSMACSTMTKLLDLLEYYLRWRQLQGGGLMQYR